jgi:hypothetical protein
MNKVEVNLEEYEELLEGRIALREKLAEAKKALEFYAGEYNYGQYGTTPSCPDWYLGEVEENDRGKKARAALKFIKK